MELLDAAKAHMASGDLHYKDDDSQCVMAVYEYLLADRCALEHIFKELNIKYNPKWRITRLLKVLGTYVKGYSWYWVMEDDIHKSACTYEGVSVCDMRPMPAWQILALRDATHTLVEKASDAKHMNGEEQLKDQISRLSRFFTGNLEYDDVVKYLEPDRRSYNDKEVATAMWSALDERWRNK